MLEFILGAVALGVIGIVWFVIGLLNVRDRDKEAQIEELSGVVNVRRNTKDKLRTDPDYAKRVRNAFNDNT